MSLSLGTAGVPQGPETPGVISVGVWSLWDGGPGVVCAASSAEAVGHGIVAGSGAPGMGSVGRHLLGQKGCVCVCACWDV